MSLPDRIYRMAKNKIRDLIDPVDDEETDDPEVLERRRRAKARSEARQELDDAMTEPTSSASRPSSVDVAPTPLRPTGPRRTPEEIARGQYASTSGTSQAMQPDPLDYHYRQLGLEPGADFTAVQEAYAKMRDRADPGRFPADSEAAKRVQTIRQQIEDSYKVLRDALDATAHRFGLLEFDPAPKNG